MADRSIDQQALDLGTKAAPGTAVLMPLLELIMKIMGPGGAPTAPGATTSQQTGPYMGPVASPEMMQGAPNAQPMANPGLKGRMGY